MEKKVSGGYSFWLRSRRGTCSFAMSVLFAFLLMSGTASAQNLPVTGTVSSTGGAPLSGVTVRVQGSDVRAVTDATGKYRISVPADASLTFSFVGQRQVQTTVAGRNVVDITMAQVPYLEQVVVTAYTEQRRGDITGAVSSVNVEAAQRQTGASVLQRLDATVPGVTVAASGSPGSRSTVRIRGISSFQNNDPLYVIDGTPVQESFLNFLNPDDITSVQVLKDASAASIYGSRASNGVVLIETTKKGLAGPPQVTLRVKTGVATPVRGYDDFLLTNALDYFQVMRQSYINAGLAVPTRIYGDPNNPTVPQYTYAGNAGSDAFGRPTNVDLTSYSYPDNVIIPGSQGTNWWKTVFGPAGVGDYNLDVAGGGDENAYRVSFNYFNQNGTAAFNDFKRGSIRANTAFNRDRLNFGENVSLSYGRHYGGMGDPEGGTSAEEGIMGKNILMQPVVSAHDANGGFGGARGLPGGVNGDNPLKYAAAHADDINKDTQIFGNVFGGFDATPQFSLKTRLGFNLGQNSFTGFTPITPENNEPGFSNGINENNNQFFDWTWTNTLRYVKAISRHNFDFLVGQEANRTTNRYIEAKMDNLLITDLDSRYIQDALGQADTKNVSSTGGHSALLSIFGKADYNFSDKYVASFTVRRDGSSNLSPGHRWGTFPAVGLGWRITNEPFLSGNRFFSDVMLRYGWGVTGNQLIPSGRIVSQFGGDRGETYYDVTGTNSLIGGFRETSIGNSDLKWEENRSTNVGADMTLFNGVLNVVVDVYKRATNNLLFDPATPATGGLADPPIINIGKMENTGIDFSIGHQAASWNVTFNGSHYKNKIVSINGDQTSFSGPISTRFGNQTINMVGKPIGSFYGFVADGYFQSQAEIIQLSQQIRATTGDTLSSYQTGAAPGRIKFRDLNGDGEITGADKTIIGNPHPSFTAGLDMGARRGHWDLNATVFGSFGNDIFENQKEFYVFQEFSTNVKNDLLKNSWTPANPNAKYPRLDVLDKTSYQISSYYIENGSYVRLRNVQLGYTTPSSFAKWIPAGTRIYLQGDNLFTITGYDGLDPSLPAAQIDGPAGDIRDQYLGVDRGAYPSNRVLSIGIVTQF